MKMPLAERFYMKFAKQPNGCWLWQGAGKGFGTINDKGKPISANRASWMIHHGEIPRGAYVRNTCKTKHCINPDHLCIDEQNFRPGEGHRNSKLTEDDVLAIRASHKSQRALASEYNVSVAAINNIINRKTWRHI